MRKKSFMNLCAKSIIGNLSESEQAVLEKWLTESDTNRKEFEQLKNAWSRIIHNKENSLPNLDIEWNKLNYRIANETKDSKSDKKWYEAIPEILYKPFYKPAIAVIVLLALSAVYIIHINNEPIPTVTVSTKPGEKKTIMLSDGSSVLLNYSSNLEYPKEFSETCEIKLNGEAYFSVKKDKKQFIIRTANAMVTMVGTKFTIKTRDAGTEIFVEEGKVNLKQSKSNRMGVNLSAGQKSIVVADLLPSAPEMVDSEEALSWLNSILIFNHTPLHEIKSELERLCGAEIMIQDEEIKNLTLSGSFRNDIPVDTLLDIVCLALELKYEKEPGKYIIKKNSDGKNSLMR
jgi:ferric-dicitrate binding protein FerR (iron transport regulator)